MNPSIRHNIDGEADRTERPHVRLCHRILREALAQHFETVEISTPDGLTAVGRAQVGAEWQDFMAFPLPAYQGLIAHFRQMAAFTPGQAEGDGDIQVHLRGRDASVRLTIRRTNRGADDVLLRFPADSGTDAAV